VIQINDLLRVAPNLSRQIDESEFLHAKELSWKLSHFKEISDDAAELIWKVDGDDLSLDGLQKLTPKAALGISKFRGRELSLNGIQEISFDVARSLALFQGHLNINGIIRLEADVAEAFRGHGGWISMRGVCSLGSGCTSVLAQGIRGHFEFGVFDVLSDEYLNCFQSLGNRLHRPKLRRLTLSAAKSRIPFEFEFVEEVTEDAVSWLSSINYSFKADGKILRLPNLRILGQKLAKQIFAFEGNIDLRGLRVIDLGTAHELSEHSGESIDLSGISKIDSDCANAIANYHGKLNLSGVKEISSDSAIALSKFRGLELNLSGISRLEYSCCTILDLKHRLILDGLEILDDFHLLSGCHLNIRNAKYITPKAAQWLALRPGDIHLDSLEKLEIEVADNLVKHRGTLRLGGLKHVNPDAAQIIASYHGTLDLSGLEFLPDDVAKALGMHEGPLLLRNIKMLSVEAAKNLARHRGNIDISGINLIDPSVFIELAALKFGLLKIPVRAALSSDQCRKAFITPLLPIIEKLKVIATNRWLLSIENFDLSSNLIYDFGFDSLDFVELIMECEEEFYIEISDEESSGLITVYDLAYCIWSKQE
jgi:acyl carrier protein